MASVDELHLRAKSGRIADDLINSQILQDLRAKRLHRLGQTKPGEQAERDNLYWLLQAIDELTRELKSISAAGKEAESQLNNITD